MSESRRSKRVAELIRGELVQCLASTVEDPTLQQVAITDVALSPDLKVAKVYFNAEGLDLKDVTKRLDAAQGFFRRVIARGLNLRSVPELRFLQDEQVGSTVRLMELFKEINHAAT
ncbi:MAG: 30S ribosome-binding factor RbfA [Deltaproteobacteria bacterium]|nr:30S ribosome-binding factor RbfA [Deltaproteobacteria bacterium]MBI3294307.1 30S ribosome-binding factor RbfA [Deltaproteobacteria bacterium]